MRLFASEREGLLSHMVLHSGLVGSPGKDIDDGSICGVVSVSAEVFSISSSGKHRLEQPPGHGAGEPEVEEELVVPYSAGQVLLLVDLVVVDTELQVLAGVGLQSLSELAHRVRHIFIFS